jgi:hypothetical protein
MHQNIFYMHLSYTFVLFHSLFIRVNALNLYLAPAAIELTCKNNYFHYYHHQPSRLTDFAG